MHRPDTNEARRRIVEILGDSVYHALGLKETLEDERRALADQDMDRLQAALDTKSRCVAKLQGIEKERQNLCTAAGFAAGPEQMADMMAWCDDADIIENCWRHLMEIAEDCLAINDTNGAIIHARTQQIGNTLTVVRGGTPAGDIYDMRGREGRESTVRSIAQA